MDDRIRQAQRQNDGTVEAQARLLREYVRAGSLHHGRVWLAAQLGHPAAMLALGVRRNDVRPTRDFHLLMPALPLHVVERWLTTLLEQTRPFVDPADDQRFQGLVAAGCRRDRRVFDLVDALIGAIVQRHTTERWTAEAALLRRFLAHFSSLTYPHVSNSNPLIPPRWPQAGNLSHVFDALEELVSNRAAVYDQAAADLADILLDDGLTRHSP